MRLSRIYAKAGLKGEAELPEWATRNGFAAYSVEPKERGSGFRGEESGEQRRPSSDKTPLQAQPCALGVGLSMGMEERSVNGLATGRSAAV
jgi:hypothetical protein